MKIYLSIFVFLSAILLIFSRPVRRDARLECGSLGINLDPILNATDYEEIIPCCYEHDLCYRNCSTTQQQCDCRFYQCLKASCVSRTFDGLDCVLLSVGGYGLVHKGGALSFAMDRISSGCATTNFQQGETSSEEHFFGNPQLCSL